ncbi:stAR-related lipid transfer protein 9 [Conger conger]|uniref:stAR-related lipid transfer protein 9 n=1 Tax=Conger conger TaxID=82655 RepID=UPI002A59E004|nr:stAR-related lipid transfer protein 9 [Conger conger]
MANVKVAIRVRPLNARESQDGGRLALQVEDKVVRVRNMKLDGRLDSPADSRERLMEFGFDYCYWSVDPEASHYASQEEVFQDLGVSVLAGASEGYNVCLFAYGQTGSGKTYTMIGTPASIGLTPRICQGLFRTEDSSAEGRSSCRVEISFLEIYNERVRDLLRSSEEKNPSPLRVREHPEKGPYVQGLSQHVVSDYEQAVRLLEEGISKRITAATHIHDASSRSHAIFSIQYTQAILENNLPSEIVSKINLVDLAGSERADPNYCRDRITEGSNINKSLVTLGIVISALAQNSQMFSSCQSINSVASEGEGSTAGSQSSSLSGGGRRHCFIPYRDSVLTWLLKDSLGGNSRTMMIATVSPSCSSYNETLSTLRYAAHARNIINKPRVNEDASVRLIRELREEIDRLKSMLMSYEMRNPSPSLSEERDGSISDLVLQNELKVEQLTKDWSDRWRDQKEVLEQYSVDINRDRAGFLIRSLLPHLIALDRDVLSTGVTFYHLREGVTVIGPHDQSQIVLQGESSCEIVNQQGTVTLRPVPGSVCLVNEREVTEPCRLAQGAVITLGGVHKFRFNHPAEAAILRERRRASEGVLICCPSDLSPLASNVRPEGAGGWEQDAGGGGAEAHPPRQRLQEQQRYVECLREEIRAEQRRAEKDLESEQAHLRQQEREIQQWILREKQRLAEVTGKQEELGVQTEPVSSARPEGAVSEAMDGGSAPPAATPLSATIGDRKRVVQEELLRHHALRRAEGRVRRKRLHYQLERVAQKRHLLEAKRELQRLENSLPSGQESPASPEPGSPGKARGPPRVLRRHSFSADILSRLYPQHAPSFRQWKLAGWTENKQEGDGSSDCDSSYSLDSLSSAYATALAEQLKQEDREMSECDEVESEAESVDSKMSQDSLAMESSQKNTTHASEPKMEKISEPQFEDSDFGIKVEQNPKSDTSSTFSSSNSKHEEKVAKSIVEPTVNCKNLLQSNSEGYLCSTNDFLVGYRAFNEYKLMTEIPEKSTTNVTPDGVHNDSNVCESDVVACFQQPELKTNSSEKHIEQTGKIRSPSNQSSPEQQSDSLLQHLSNSQTSMIKSASPIYSITKNFSQPPPTENHLETVEDHVEKGSSTQYSGNCTSSYQIQTKDSEEITHDIQEAKRQRESSCPSYAQIESTEIIKRSLLEGANETAVTKTTCLVNVELEVKNRGSSFSSHSPSQFKHDGLYSKAESRVTGFGDEEIFQSECTGHQQCSNSSNVDRQRGKQKRFRRANPRAPSTSSTESMLDSSPEEKVMPRVYPGRIQSRPETHTRFKQDVLASSSRECSGFTKGQSVTSLVTKTVGELDDKPRNGGNRCQRQPHSNTRPLKSHIVPHTEKKLIPHSENAKSLKEGSHETTKSCHKQLEQSVTKQEKVQQQESQTLPKKDAAMHFASSDINPFVHSWQETGAASKGASKNQVFGSATDIFCKQTLLDDRKSLVTRCHSVDNGLNNQNSPFCSHLSTYANKKELSSSFEDFKEQDSLECQRKLCHYMSYPDSAQNPRTCDSYRNVASGDLGHSGQVDEIMLVYSSEQESVVSPLKDQSMLACDRSTQTLMVDGRQKKKNRHKRSSTQVPMTRMDTNGTGPPTTWASLQNMSLQLSELIHNTSDLLGNIQCIRAKESLPRTDWQSDVVAHSHAIGSGKRDCSTQTAVDIGIQTEGFPVLGGYREVLNKQIIEKANPHEVNVIVKVIGSDVLSVSQDQKDVTLNVQDRAKDGRTAEKMQSMPDLWHDNSGAADWTHRSMEAAPLKAQASTPSLVTNMQDYRCSNPDSPLDLPHKYIPEQVFSSNIGISRVSSSSSNTANQGNQTSSRDDSLSPHARPKMCPKQVCFTDRASSPILTVEPATGAQLGRSKSTQCLVDHQRVEMKESVLEKHKVQSASLRRLDDQPELGFLSKRTNREERGSQTFDQSGKPSSLISNRSVGHITPQNVSDFSEPVQRYSMNLITYKGNEDPKVSRTVTDGAKQQTLNKIPVSKPSRDLSPKQSPRWATLSPYLSDGTPLQSQVSFVRSRKQDECALLNCRQESSSEKTSQLLAPFDKQLSASTLDTYRRTFGVGECWSGPSEPSNISEDTVQLQEDDDAVSLAPSECNTDVLININPLNINQKVHQRVPEDLPMHNKFTNWSGVSYQPTSIASSSVVQSASKRSERVKNKSSCESPGTSESQQSGLEAMTPRSRRAKEIEMLRKEREQVMANVRLDMNSHQLTVEMTEAKLHYGLGETDALLKMLQTSSKEEPSSVPTKQQLYDRHRRSIDGLRQEREARLQTCRRARSLSPGPSKNSPSPDQGAEPPTRTESPSRRREYLQQLRQEVVESTRIPEPPKQSGQCPSEIELMLRDYGRAREEARTEIARARDRLRERTEQEKRRLQQQALSRAVKDDLRLRTRVSSSTLCTGSSLSLSSGPTSGYNSSNTVLLKEGVGVNSAQTLQVPGWPEDGSLNIRGRPPMRASQNFDTRRPWLSVQDVRLEVPVFGSDSQLSSPYGHHDTPSPRIASSIATSYQDIAKYTHDRAIAEVRSAAAGDLGNLLEGRAAGGWRYQGTERGVQAFYKPSSCPTVHGFLGATELERPLPSLWCMVRDHSKAHLYNESVRSAWTRPLDDSTQFVYLLTDTSVCHLSQPRDFCCISTESKQQDEWVLAMRSVFEESLPRPTVDAVRGELLPSAWVLQPTLHHGREVVRVVYLLQVDLGTPALPQRLLNVVARKQAAVIAELDTFLSL